MNYSFINSVKRGQEQFNLITGLSNTQLIELRQNTAKCKSACIAESMFNRLPPLYSFTENMARFISDPINIAFHNRDMEKEIAYFRFNDGSTIHLSGKIVFWSSPCFECLDPVKCGCNLNEGLDL